MIIPLRIQQHLPLLILIAIVTTPIHAADPAPASITIQTNFPGGNIKLINNTPGSVKIEPDLRGDRPWFYWYFQATPTNVGKVSFTFPPKVAGFKHGAIGFQGPAISLDNGNTWNWMGTKQVDGNTFTYHFKNKRPVRFAVTIPYTAQNLQQFLDKHKQNSFLKTTTITQSKSNRPVTLLQIGKHTPDKKTMLVTARHHAAETIASYVLEGFLAQAMSNTPEGIAFRKHYVLYAIPIVDTDGVEQGDQGKNRRPHDHNRDYNPKSIYPEITAIKKLADDKQITHAIDFHCPTLVMQDHQIMYFAGVKNVPKHNFANISEFAKNIKANLPENAPFGPLVWLKTLSKPAPKNSNYFAFRPNAVVAATLEIPFAPPGKSSTPNSLHLYGQRILKAWTLTQFKSE